MNARNDRPFPEQRGGADDPVCYRLEPNKRLVPRFDSCCIAEFPVARADKMGFRVIDDCCEDHIM